MAGTDINGFEYSPTLSALDAASLKLVLNGDSVVDWTNIPLDTADAGRRLMEVNGYNIDDPNDIEHLSDIMREAVLYLTDIHGYHMPAELEHSDDILKLFAWASGLEPARPELRSISGMLLKVINVLNFLSARELLSRLPISEEELNARLSAKIFSRMEELQANCNLVEFASGQKSRSSMLTKLLVKAETKASHIFDVLRCRVVVEQKQDLLPALLFLLHNLIPFNYISACESKNNLIPDHLIRPYDRFPSEQKILNALRNFQNHNNHCDSGGRLNEFSGPTYRSINFIASVPLNVEDLLEDMDPTIAVDYGHLIITQMEFQLLDRQTALENEAGANSHIAYKNRQLERVRDRIVPRFDPEKNVTLERVDIETELNYLTEPFK